RAPAEEAGDEGRDADQREPLQVAVDEEERREQEEARRDADYAVEYAFVGGHACTIAVARGTTLMCVKANPATHQKRKPHRQTTTGILECARSRVVSVPGAMTTTSQCRRCAVARIAFHACRPWACTLSHGTRCRPRLARQRRARGPPVAAASAAALATARATG